MVGNMSEGGGSSVVQMRLEQRLSAGDYMVRTEMKGLPPRRREPGVLLNLCNASSPQALIC